MAIRESESTATQFHLRFIVEVVDGCIESEWAVRELLGSGLLPQNIQMFYAHQKPVHLKSIGLPLGRLQVTFQYLEDLLGLDASSFKEYEEYWKAGRHILLANVYQDSDAKTIAVILGKAQSHAGRILGYGNAAKLPVVIV